MIPPPDAIREALTAAAIKWRVPYTVLAAIAFKESSYDPSAKGKAGELGLMQLRANIVTRYSVSKPLDAAESAMGAAEFIAALGHACDWEWHTVFAAYNSGPKARDNAWTPRVIEYSRQVAVNRIALQNRTAASGPTVLESLGTAITALCALNPDDVAARALLARWTTATKASPPTGALDSWLLGRSFTAEYATVYDRAVLTDGAPPPWLLEPRLYPTLKGLASQAGDVIRTAMPKPPELPDLNGLLIAGACIAGVWFLMQSGDRS
jgi:hypothetical protein